MAQEDSTKTSDRGMYRMIDLPELLNQLQEIPQFQQLAELLKAQGKMPSVERMQGNGEVGGDYHPATNTIRVDTAVNPNVLRSAGVHELTHAFQQLAATTLKNADSDTPGVTNTLRRLLTGQNFKPLLETIGRTQKADATPLEAVYPKLFSETPDYRKSRAEQQAYGYGNSVLNSAPTLKIPHVDATNATEVAMMQDLVRRQLMINSTAIKK